MKYTLRVGLALGTLAVGMFLYLKLDRELPSTGQNNKISEIAAEETISSENPVSPTSFAESGFNRFVTESSEEPRIQPVRIEQANGSRKVEVRKPTSPKPRFASLKDKHLAYLRDSEVLESKEGFDRDGNPTRATLVRANHKSFQNFIIRDTLSADKTEVKQSYVYIANHLLVQFKDTIADDDIREFEVKHGIKKSKNLLQENTYLFEYQDLGLAKQDRLEEETAIDPLVAYSTGNSLSYSTRVPNDTLYNTLWGLANNGQDPIGDTPFTPDMDIQADAAWENLTDCSNTIVAVLDTGIDPNHPDLKDNVLPGLSRDYSSANIDDFIDRQAHGTHVAGTIGALGDNQLGITGVCWKAQIIAVKVLGDEGFGTSEMIINGLTYVSQTNAKLMNLSLGGGPPSQLEVNAIATNTSAGKLLVIAAGNENNDNDLQPAYPASYEDPGIISVAALHGGGDLAVFSNFGQTSVDIAAPGQDIVSTIPTSLAPSPNEAYAPLSGTSMASPHVAGAVALFWSYAPDLTAQEVKAELLASSVTGNFSKAVNNSRSMDLNAFMDAVKAKATIQEVGDVIRPTRGSTFSLSLQTEEKYAPIQKIEIFHDEELIGESSGGATSIDIDVPLGFAEAEVFARVTDTQGRQFESQLIALDIDLNKDLTFGDVNALSLAGSASCKLVRVDGDGQEEVLYQASVSDKRSCQKLCDIVGPLVFSTKSEIQCSQGSTVIYQGKN
ncbi:S8 family peptidase [Pseudobacteriovorax antillogorgiicola]|uniref:Subtilase family protein n=1 Tax=Pseudobacteriovorax antillogorgiicola TaxID=1513793 RepID=A0A1Y6C8H3_9BACT|nr:S8 family peptidase [Pseudobacteriovorax antillogorgiicola]TCS50656.1 subtilase family protein [Pseudobacteriovorax antillogorgiicola]SMF39803.1 Subtilase family protein [Pseudobacteriovorax antillogorgiicola]